MFRVLYITKYTIMKSFTLFFILILLSFLGCQQPVQNYPEAFTQSDTLILTPLKTIKNELLATPRNISLADNYLILQDNMDGKCFAIFNTQTGELIQRFGSHGHGPNEIMYPINQEISDNYFYFFDSGNKKLNVYSLDSLKKGSARYHLKSIPLEFNTTESATFRQAVLLPNGQIIANCSHPEGKLVLTDTNGRELQAFYPDYPQDTDHKNETYLSKSFAFQYNGIYDIHSNTLYNISTTTGHIEIFKVLPNCIQRTHNRLFYLPKYKSENNQQMYGVLFLKDNVPGLFNPELGNNCFYAAYQNTPPKEHTYIIHDLLFCFDKQANPLKYYKLSRRISSFCIDNSTNTIYAIGLNPESLEPCILCGQLKE